MSTSQWPLAAVCQVTATPDKAANLSACTQLLEEAKERGATMVFLPEGFDYIGSSRAETLSLSEPLTGDTITQYCQLARWEKLFILCQITNRPPFFPQYFLNIWFIINLHLFWPFNPCYFQEIRNVVVSGRISWARTRLEFWQADL